MGLVDTLAPSILATLFGLTALILGLAFVRYWLIPKYKLMTVRRNLAQHQLDCLNESKKFIDDLLVEVSGNSLLSSKLEDELVRLHANLSAYELKEIN